jgi:RNA polymerase primary sigma factor
MKTANNRIFRFKTAKLTSPRARLRVSRLSRRLRKSTQPDIIGRPDVAPAPFTKAEPTRTESLHGDAFQLYLREIGQVKLLTPDEEIALAKRIRRGDKKAREHMIKANLRLVVKIAREYEGLGLPLLDLINEGNIGLMKGVDRFDTRKGAKLSTYASWWIKQAIRRALANQSKTIRLPVYVLDNLAHMRRAEVKLRETLDREPTDEEIADDLGLDARRVRRYREASRAPVSLDAPIGDEDSAPVSEVVADTNAAAPFDHIVSNTDNEMVREVLANLDEREGKILAMRFGLDNGQPRTLEELGKKFHLTRERIRQIQEIALRKLRGLMEKRDQPPALAAVVTTE